MPVPGLPDEIPVDEHISRDDREYEDAAESSFTLASTLHDFQYESGRRYPSYRYGSHPFPHDDLSLRNEKVLHHMLLYILDNKLFLAPVDNPRQILDVKCGQGLWAENVADLFPDAEVVAMDTTPRERSTYPNCTFFVQSINDEWVLDTPDMKFDFIYARNLFANSSQFADFYRQCYENLAPGGYLEHFEVEIIPRCDDGTARPDSYVKKCAQSTPDLSTAFGTEYNIALQMTSLIKEAGFVDVEETRMKLPLGPWSTDPRYRQVGEWFEAFFKSGLQGWIMAPMVRSMGFTTEQVNETVEKTFQEVDAREQHHYFEAVIVYGRKPE